ncbi:MAG: catalase/peroxidase HPI [Chitinophagaceae bacterium]|nr:catalase/peroxidase HPI [Chitinophagaceae bacterium]
MTADNNKPTSAATGSAAGKCPFPHGMASKSAASASQNANWWPDMLRLDILRQHHANTNPLGTAYNYANEFAKLDLKAIKQDIYKLMRTSQPWWPADYGHYGPLFIRMAWHSAGTYRTYDGRGGAGSGAQRFAPLNSWPDNVNLDKARMLLWPIKQQYGKQISWADLLVLAGNCALEDMGLPTYGFGGGRVDVWQAEEDVYWGPEKTWLDDKRYTGERDLENPLAAVQMGLIYVNPEGPNGNPDPLKSAIDIRETFARMAMNDYETVALVAGGHTFGKAHGAADPSQYVTDAPAGADITAQSLGWQNSYETGSGDHTIGSGIEGAWTPNPIQWDNDYFSVLLGYEWELTKSPAGAHQWTPTAASNARRAPMANSPQDTQALMMTTADMALKMDPIYAPISKHFHEHPQEFADAFAKAWYKLTHRDMGPKALYLGAEVPAETLIWQDPIPAATLATINDAEATDLKTQILAAGLPIGVLVHTAWASASTYRNSDKRGGANGARIALAPQKDWVAHNPKQLATVLGVLEVLQNNYNQAHEGKKHLSLADLIVLAGCAAIEQAAADAGHTIKVPFAPGRMDATQADTDIESFAVLQPMADGFTNYYAAQHIASPEEMLVDKAQQLTLSIPELTALIGGMRVLGANYDGSANGVFTHHPQQLSNDFFVHLLDINTKWVASGNSQNAFIGSHRASGVQQWPATRADLIFGAHAELRAVAEVFAAKDGLPLFLETFVNAWAKVMNLDRFDLHR